MTKLYTHKANLDGIFAAFFLKYGAALPEPVGYKLEYSRNIVDLSFDPEDGALVMATIGGEWRRVPSNDGQSWHMRKVVDGVLVTIFDYKRGFEAGIDLAGMVKDVASATFITPTSI